MRNRTFRTPVTPFPQLHPGRSTGFHDLMKGKGKRKSESPGKGEESLPFVEEALFDFCNELAGIILKRLHERRPGGVREEICGALESSGNFPREQAYSLFALALELIRAKAKGGYRRDQRELSRLIGKALGAGNPESLN